MATGTRTTLTDTTNQKRSISDAIFMIDWTKAPLLRLFGLEAESKFRLVNWPSTKAEILEDTMSPTASALNGGINNSVTSVVVTTGQGQYFRQGDIILVDTEQMLVISVSTDTLTVNTRPYGGTTAASHSSGAAVTIVGRAMPEASDFTTGNTTVVTAPYNYTQIISEAVKVSKTEQAITKYGVEDTMDYHVAKLFADGGSAGRLPITLQKTFYYGQRVQRAAGNAYGSMGGFKVFVTTNVADLGGATLQRSDIHTKIRQIRDAGGECTHLVTGSWGIEKINAMYEGLIRTTNDTERGGSAITMVKTPHGEVEVVYDWLCPASDMYFVNKAKVGWMPLRKFEVGEIQTQGDYYVSDVVGEYTFLLANEKSHGYLTNFSTTT